MDLKRTVTIWHNWSQSYETFLSKINYKFYEFSQNRPMKHIFAISFKKFILKIQLKCYKHILLIVFTPKIWGVSLSKCLIGLARGHITSAVHNLTKKLAVQLLFWSNNPDYFHVSDFFWQKKIIELKKRYLFHLIIHLFFFLLPSFLSKNARIETCPQKWIWK